MTSTDDAVPQLPDGAAHINPSPCAEAASPSIMTPSLVPPPLHPFSIHTLAPLAPASVLGVLARLGIEYLGTYDGQSIFTLAWVQFIGCLLMGVFLAHRDSITASYPPLYLALTTGFCGSLTTFSGWQLDVFLAWASSDQVDRTTIHTIVQGATRLFFTIALSLGGIMFGTHVAKVLFAIPAAKSSPPPPQSVRLVVSAVCGCAYLATIPAFVFLSQRERFIAVSALLYSFPGTLLRYTLSIRLNNPRFPTGTLTANLFGTALLAAFYALQHATNNVNGDACVALQGLSDGFCGCLTTVSTFALEVRSAKTRTAWVYVVISVVAAQMLCVTILVPVWVTGSVSRSLVCRAT